MWRQASADGARHRSREAGRLKPNSVYDIRGFFCRLMDVWVS